MRDFLQSGSLGPVRLGMSRSEVEKQLGQPDDWSSNRTHNRLPIIWKYGHVEFHFDDNDTVHLIFLDDFVTQNNKIDLWIFSEQLSLEEAEEALMSSGVEFRGLPSPSDEDGIVLITIPTEIELSFSPAEDGFQKLTAVSQSAFKHPQLYRARYT